VSLWVLRFARLTTAMWSTLIVGAVVAVLTL
jgi:hypothetical protein